MKQGGIHTDTRARQYAQSRRLFGRTLIENDCIRVETNCVRVHVGCPRSGGASEVSDAARGVERPWVRGASWTEKQFVSRHYLGYCALHSGFMMVTKNMLHYSYYFLLAWSTANIGFMTSPCHRRISSKPTAAILRLFHLW